MKPHLKRVLIAAGGSGGHLFPAQQLGAELAGQAEVLFAGYHLSKSAFFQQDSFLFREIAASPLTFRFLDKNIVGLFQSIQCLRQFRPDVVVGFGSFHTFPILLACYLPPRL